MIGFPTWTKLVSTPLSASRSAVYTAVWSSTVEPLNVQERLHVSDLYSPYVADAHFYPYPGPFPYLASHLFQFHAAATMPMMLLCMILLLLLRYLLGMPPVIVCSRLQRSDE